MEKLKAITKFLWIPIVAVVLWIVYKLFVQKSDDPLNITQDNSGLSSRDIELYNLVVSNLASGGDPYSLTNIFVPLVGVDYAKGAVQLGELLQEVSNKTLFAVVYAKRNNTLLTTDIVNIYGSKVYSMIAQNVVNFGDFIL